MINCFRYGLIRIVIVAALRTACICTAKRFNWSIVILWVDVETTGFDPQADRLLEVAMLATDDDLIPIDGGVGVVLQARDLFQDLGDLDQVILDMHTANGLLADAASAAALEWEQANAALLQYMLQHAAEPPQMAGSSVHFDRAWLAIHFPAVHMLFDHRNIDVSTIKELCKRWDRRVYEARPVPQRLHRAMPDIHDSIAELKWYRGQFICGLWTADDLRQAAKHAADYDAVFKKP